jgi:hypothetical protein
MSHAESKHRKSITKYEINDRHGFSWSGKRMFYLFILVDEGYRAGRYDSGVE